MNNLKKIIIGISLSLAMVSAGLINACKEEKEVKVTEEVQASSTPVATVEDKNVNVDVHIDNPQQPTTETKKTDVTNVIVDKQDNTKINNDIASVNANLQKLQAQVKTANEQSKAEINKQIQQMNIEKQKLQQQIAAFQLKNNELNQAAQQQKANMEKTREEMEKAKKEYAELNQMKLDNFVKKMDTLKEKVGNLDTNERAEVDKQITKIEELKKAVDQKMTALDSSVDATSFKTLRSQIDTMIIDLEKNYTRLVTDRTSLR